MCSSDLSVQQLLAEGISKVLGHGVVVRGSGRTDAGVHAEGQVAAFTTSAWGHPSDRLVRAINGHLPRDISVLNCRRVVLGFDPIRQATGKRYRYTIRNSSVPDPLRYQYHWWIPRVLDVAGMVAGASKLIGTHDFKGFETLGSPRKTSVRTVRKLEVREVVRLGGRELWVEIEADGFLYNMVRNIAGALVEIGKGRFSPAWLETLLEGRERDSESQTAPARGLCLMRVDYPESVFLEEASS